MNQMTNRMMDRSEIFLDEMGVGVQWKLRNPGLQADVSDDVQADFDDSVEALAPADVAPLEAPLIAPRAAAPEVVVEAEAKTEFEAEFEAEPAPAAAPALAAADDSNAWFDDAPAPPRAAPVSADDIAVMDSAGLKNAISSCTRCELCATRRNAVHGRGDSGARFIAVSAGPSRLDEKDGRAIAGEAGQLLDNMLKAIALAPDTDVYVTNLVKCRPSAPDGADRAPTSDEVTACRPFLDRELALTSADMIMSFGQAAAKGLGAAARGKVFRYKDLPLVASYHPDDLLRRPEDKAKAWGDLCLARTARE